MKIILLYPYFKGENSPGHSMTFRLVERLAQRGHIITVITMNNGYMETKETNDLQKFACFGENKIFQDNVQILSCASRSKQHKSIIHRLIFYFEYTFFVFRCLFACNKPDVVLCSSPPLFHSIPAIIFSYLRNVPVLLEVRDLWPRSLIEMGLVKSKINVWFLKLIERFAYNGSKRIVCYTSGIYEDISKTAHNSKLDLIHCGVDLNALNPNDKLCDSIVESFGLSGKKVVLYFGALGYANNIEYILKSAEALKYDDNIIFLLIGDGVARKAIKSNIKLKKLHNVKLLPAVPKVDAAKYINISTVCLVTLLERPVFSGAIPTKMIDYMACAKPVVSNVQGEAAELLSLSGAGITTNPYDLDSFVLAIKKFCYDPNLAACVGALGRKWVENEFSIEEYLNKYENSLSMTVNGD